MDLSEMGGHGDVLIFYGRTHDDLVQQVQHGITAETEIRDQRQAHEG